MNVQCKKAYSTALLKYNVALAHSSLQGKERGTHLVRECLFCEKRDETLVFKTDAMLL